MVRKIKQFCLFLAVILMLTSSAEAVEVIINLGSHNMSCHNDCRAPYPPMVYQGTQHYYDSRTSRYSNGYVVQDVTDHYIDGTRPRSGRVYREVNSQVWWNGHYINR